MTTGRINQVCTVVTSWLEGIAALQTPTLMLYMTDDVNTSSVGVHTASHWVNQDPLDWSPGLRQLSFTWVKKTIRYKSKGIEPMHCPTSIPISTSITANIPFFKELAELGAESSNVLIPKG